MRNRAARARSPTRAAGARTTRTRSSASPRSSRSPTESAAPRRARSPPASLPPRSRSACPARFGEETLAELLQTANDRIYRHSLDDPSAAGMGTVVTALLVDEDAGDIAIGHVGDSRAYRLRDGDASSS